MHESTKRLYESTEKVLKKNLTQTELARQFNVPSQSVNNWEKRGVPSAIAIEAEEKYGLSPTWILKGVGREITNESRNTDDLYIPIRNVTASMGHGMVASEFEMVVDEIKVSRAWIRRELPQVTSLTNLQIIAGIGDSMSPTYDSGDLLLVDTGVKEVFSDLIYVFSYKGSTYVKRIFINPVASKIHVKSDNPAAGNWDPIAMTDMDDFTIHGRVIYAWKGFKL